MTLKPEDIRQYGKKQIVSNAVASQLIEELYAGFYSIAEIAQAADVTIPAVTMVVKKYRGLNLNAYLRLEELKKLPSKHVRVAFMRHLVGIHGLQNVASAMQITTDGLELAIANIRESYADKYLDYFARFMSAIPSQVKQYPNLTQYEPLFPSDEFPALLCSPYANVRPTLKS